MKRRGFLKGLAALLPVAAVAPKIVEAELDKPKGLRSVVTRYEMPVGPWRLSPPDVATDGQAVLIHDAFAEMDRMQRDGKGIEDLVDFGEVRRLMKEAGC